MIYNCDFLFSSFITIEIYVVSVLAVFFIFVYSFNNSGLLKRDKTLSILGIIFLLVGGAYNLIVRLVSGCVPDPFSFFGFFSFNYADVLVNIGFIMILSIYLRDSFDLKAPNFKKD